MATKDSSDDAPVNFDDLLGGTDTAPASETPEPETAPAMTADEARIAELEAELNKPEPQFEESDDDVEDEEETPQQRRIKELEDQIAKKNSRIFENAPAQFNVPTEDGEHIIFHVVEDGFTAQGQVWYRGQEFDITVGDSAYKQTQDRNGKSWLDLLNDLPGQYLRWGKQMIAPGPFIPRPGEKFEDSVANEDKRRRRAMPLLPTT